jgi:hypothetical protein
MCGARGALQGTDSVGAAPVLTSIFGQSGQRDSTGPPRQNKRVCLRVLSPASCRWAINGTPSSAMPLCPGRSSFGRRAPAGLAGSPTAGLVARAVWPKPSRGPRVRQASRAGPWGEPCGVRRGTRAGGPGAAPAGSPTASAPYAPRTRASGPRASGPARIRPARACPARIGPGCACPTLFRPWVRG